MVFRFKKFHMDFHVWILQMWNVSRLEKSVKNTRHWAVFSFCKVEQEVKYLDHSIHPRKSIWYFFYKITTDEKLLTLLAHWWSKQFSLKIINYQPETSLRQSNLGQGTQVTSNFKVVEKKKLRYMLSNKTLL